MIITIHYFQLANIFSVLQQLCKTAIFFLSFRVGELLGGDTEAVVEIEAQNMDMDEETGQD